MYWNQIYKIWVRSNLKTHSADKRKINNCKTLTKFKLISSKSYRYLCKITIKNKNKIFQATFVSSVLHLLLQMSKPYHSSTPDYISDEHKDRFYLERDCHWNKEITFLMCWTFKTRINLPWMRLEVLRVRLIFLIIWFRSFSEAQRIFNNYCTGIVFFIIYHWHFCVSVLRRCIHGMNRKGVLYRQTFKRNYRRIIRCIHIVDLRMLNCKKSWIKNKRLLQNISSVVHTNPDSGISIKWRRSRFR